MHRCAWGKDWRRRYGGRLLRGGQRYPTLCGVWRGNPARLLKYRFDGELIDLLLAFRWWELPPEELAEVLPLLCDPDLEQVRQELRARVRSRAAGASQPELS